MKAKSKLYRKVAVLFLAFLLVACDAPPPTSLPPTRPPRPTAISLPTPYNNNIVIRIDSVTIKRDDGDGGQGGEVYFAILATREYGDSAKLVLPGTDTFQANVGDKIEPGKFSLAVNNVKFSENEAIAVYLIGFENDSQSLENETLTNLALDAALELVKKRIPGGSIVPYVLENLSGLALDWWQEEDILGEYSAILSEDNNWLAGQQYHVESTNGNLEITFTILQNFDVLGTEPGEKVVLTIINNDSSPIEKLYISNINCPDKDTTGCTWGENLLKESIAPNGSYEILVPAGVYDLRAESANSFWERSALDLTANQRWIITSNR